MTDTQPPPTFGRYEVIRQLESGGMADIYLARHPRLGIEVVIKAPRVEHLSPDVLNRFMLEAEAVTKLDHDIVVAPIDFDDEDGRPYLVMRYMAGGSLADRLDAEKRLSPQAALPIIERVAEALDHAHERGVLHRDVKPGNILFNERGRAFLADFGIAKFERQGDDVTQAHLTQQGYITGTVAYVSPEQVRSLLEPDGRSDVYSLGIVIYEMLAGGLPYVDTSPTLQAALHVTAPIPSLRAVRPDLPETIDEVIRRALAKDRDERYPTAGELAGALREALTSSPPPPPPTNEIPAPPPTGETAAPFIPPTNETPAPAAKKPPSTATSLRPDPGLPQPGQTWLGRFQVKQQRVVNRHLPVTAYLAHDTATKRDVDIWLWPKVKSGDTGRVHRALRGDVFKEHEAIASIIAHGNERGYIWLAAPHMPGGTLADRLSDGPLSPDETAAIMTRLAAALDYAHDRGQVHGQLRPRHIRFDADGTARLAFLDPWEFIAYEMRATDMLDATDIDYVDPARGGGQPTAADDIYALGGILFAMLTGLSPRGYDPDDESAVGPVAAARAGLPLDIRQVVDCAMDPDPAARYQTAGELAAEFGRAVERVGSAGKAAPRPTPPPTPPPKAAAAPAQHRPSPTALFGSDIPEGYTIIDQIAADDQTRLFLAKNTSLNREVAIRRWVADPGPAFGTMMNKVGQFKYGSLVPHYGFNLGGGRPYLITPLYPGGSLADRLKEDVLTLKEAVDALSGIADGLNQLHGHGFFYLRLSPDDILFDAQDRAFLSLHDMDPEQGRGSGPVRRKALVSRLQYEFTYAAPEVITGRSVTYRADIYSLGVILFEMLTGAPPYQATSLAALKESHHSDPIPSILSLRPDLPPDLQPVIERALAKERNDRYFSTLEFWLALQRETR